jgi:hypothetical protein
MVGGAGGTQGGRVLGYCVGARQWPVGGSRRARQRLGNVVCRACGGSNINRRTDRKRPVVGLESRLGNVDGNWRSNVRAKIFGLLAVYGWAGTVSFLRFSVW